MAQGKLPYRRTVDHLKPRHNLRFELRNLRRQATERGGGIVRQLTHARVETGFDRTDFRGGDENGRRLPFA